MLGQGVATPADSVVEALIEEARQRHRRRQRRIGLLVIILMTVAAAVVLVGSLAGRHQPSRPTAHAQVPAVGGRMLPGAHTILITWPAGSCCESGTRLYVDDLGRGKLSQRVSPGISGGDIPYVLTPVGRWLVYSGAYHGVVGVWAIRDDLAGRARLLGRDGVVVPSAVPGQVLVVSPSENTIRSVSVGSGRPGPPIRLPRPAGSVLAGTDRGYLVVTTGGVLELWRPGGPPKIISTVGRGGAGLGFAMDARTVVYGSACTDEYVTSTRWYANVPVGYSVCQVLHVINLVSGRRLSFAAPNGTLGWASYGSIQTDSSIAPGDGLLAAPAEVSPAGDGKVRLFVLRLGQANAQPLAVPRSDAPGYAISTWSTSLWLFYEGPGGTVQAFQPATSQSANLGIPCRQCMAMVSVRD